MVVIFWTYTAKDDLNAIYDFIAINSIYYAKREIQKIYETTEILKSQPEMGKTVNEDNTFSLRELVYKNYRIIYEIISSNRIDILFIHHGARSLKERINS